MEDDRGWEDAAFNTRHLHNHNDRGGQAGNVRHEFQVRSTMGTHLIKCAALDRLLQQQQQQQKQQKQKQQQEHKKKKSAGGDRAEAGGGPRARASAAAGPAGISSSSSSSSKKARKGAADGGGGGGGGDVVLEIYRLTDGEDGLLGSLRCGRVFEATVAFAGSRKTLAKIARELGGGEDGADATRDGVARDGIRRSGSRESSGGVNGKTEDADWPSSGGEVDSEDGDAASQVSGEGRRRQRVATFEKNSFRQPKFWFRWQGVVAADGVPLDTIDGDDDDEEISENRTSVHGSGYLVFSGNDCKRFQGTMTSEQMGWNNAKMTGWKTKPQPERDFEIQWTREF